MSKVSSFPHISPPELELACQELARRLRACKSTQAPDISMHTVSKYDSLYWSISCPLHSVQGGAVETDHPLDDNEVYENDEEFLEVQSPPVPVLEYDIIHSSTWQVPVLYISIKDASFRFPPTMDNLYRHVIPEAYKSQTEAGSIGPFGGITITDHPHTNAPVFFIHPCMTASVLESSLESKDITPIDYLVLWIGATGIFAGLTLPLDIAAQPNGR
ncbi:hypothetical protein EJ04DRAFT_572334 [Polyplosphaeria fusca]|uniref:Ubiquitin-like-conjugating enzyme ATG10 n=1 Tax=Polyplosphaeria fusca TaxID=682080 RepID=A0A9P4RAU7_9PLEO|nr:hypothetical protein EJ04DRAFT_572334 [Polyplosphaeria fusca]